MKKRCEAVKPESSGPSGGKRKERDDDEEYGKGKGKQKRVGSEREKEEVEFRKEMRESHKKVASDLEAVRGVLMDLQMQGEAQAARLQEMGVAFVRMLGMLGTLMERSDESESEEEKVAEVGGDEEMEETMRSGADEAEVGGEGAEVGEGVAEVGEGVAEVGVGEAEVGEGEKMVE